MAALLALSAALPARADLLPPPEEPKPLRVAHVWEGVEQRVLEKLARRFEEAEKAKGNAVRVELIAAHRTTDGRAFVQKLLERGEVDLVICDQLQLGPWRAARLLAPVDEEAQAQAADMAEYARKPLFKDGHAWGLPLSVDTLALFYNRKLIKTRPPVVLRREWLESLRALIDPASGRAILALEPDLPTFALFFGWNQESWGREPGALVSGSPPALQLDSESATLSLLLMGLLQRKQHLAVLSHEEIARRFNQGLLAMAIGGAQLTRELFAIEAEVMPLPRFDPETAGVHPLLSATPLLFVDAALVPSRARRGARTLAAFLVGPESAQARARDARQVVPSEAVLSDPWINADAWSRGLRAAAASAVPADDSGALVGVEERVRSVVSSALAGDAAWTERVARGAAGRVDLLAQPSSGAGPAGAGPAGAAGGGLHA